MMRKYRLGGGRRTEFTVTAPPPPVVGTFPTSQTALTSQAPIRTDPLPSILVETALVGYETKVARIVNPATWGGGRVRHAYSLRPAWNIDETRLVLAGGPGTSVLLNGQSLTLIGNSPVEISLWSMTDPNRVYNVSGNDFRCQTVSPAATVFATDIPAYTAIHHGGGEANQSYNDRYFAMLGQYSGGAAAFVFDTVNRTVRSTRTYPGLTYRSQLNNATMTPDGNYMIVGVAMSGSDRYHELVRASDGALIGRFQDGRMSHATTAVRSDGSSCFVTADLQGNLASWPVGDNITTVRAGKRIEVPAARFSATFHISATCFNRPGYVYLSTFMDGGAAEEAKPLFRENYSVKLDGSYTIERFGQSMANEDAAAYEQEPQLCASPSGDRVIWATNWHNAIAGTVGHSFVAGMNPIR